MPTRALGESARAHHSNGQLSTNILRDPLLKTTHSVVVHNVRTRVSILQSLRDEMVSIFINGIDHDLALVSTFEAGEILHALRDRVTN